MRADDVLTRAVGIGHATVDAYARQREQVAADALNRLATEQRYVVASMDAVLRLTELCYVMVGNRTVNIDNLTWRIVINVPWSKSGGKHYGLREWESRVLRGVMVGRSQQTRRRPLFSFGNGRWYLNLDDYPAIDVAIDYWRNNKLTIDEWLIHADALRESARVRMAERRER